MKYQLIKHLLEIHIKLKFKIKTKMAKKEKAAKTAKTRKEISRKEVNGLQEEWYENGQLNYRENWKNGWKVPLPPQYEIEESNKNESFDNPFTTPNTQDLDED